MPTLISAVRTRAQERPKRVAYSFLSDGESESACLTYTRLDSRARAVAEFLRRRGAVGQRALLLYPPGLDFIIAFLGCLYAGVVAVPAYSLRFSRRQSRLQAVIGDAAPRFGLTTSQLLRRARRLKEWIPQAGSMQWLACDDAAIDSSQADELAGAWRPPRLKGSSLAFLQYTSGSTSAPKGVMVSHANLAHNEEMIRRAFAMQEDSVVVSWLPLHHDMGLIGGVLQPLYAGARCILMSPLAFLKSPLRWLKALSRYRGTVSGGPNFAFDLCVQRIGRQERAGLDLSSWRVAFNGSEPLRAETLERFAEAFAPCGFRPESFFPCYGLAEATLFVSGQALGNKPCARAFDADSLQSRRVFEPSAGCAKVRSLVSNGRPWMGQEVVIADPATGRRCCERQIGEIWVKGPSVARGYWRNPKDSARSFSARLEGAVPYLRTGDLGFLLGGELFVTGRLKDLIIIRGRNHYPQDIERTVEQAHPALRPGCGAAFGVDAEGQEHLVVVQEVQRRQAQAAQSAAQAIRQAVAEEHEVTVHEVVLIRAGTLPKTTSGKIRRRACRDLYWKGGLKAVASSRLAPGQQSAGGWQGSLTREALLALPGDERLAVLESYLRHEVAQAACTDAAELDPDRPVTSLGLDSLATTRLQHRLEADLDISLPLGHLMGQPLGVISGCLLSEVESAAPSPLDRLQAGPGSDGEFSLSPGQRALWFLDRLTPGSAAYQIVSAARIRTPLNIEAFRRALEALAERHAALRTTFHERDGEPWQQVHAHLPPEFRLCDGAGRSSRELSDELQKEAARPFDLTCGPLLRAVLWIGPDGGATVLAAVHHIISDFWSLSVMARELTLLYRQLCGGPPADLEPLTVSCADYVHWQQEQLAGAWGERRMAYWTRRLGGKLPDLKLPSDRPRPPVLSDSGAAEHMRLKPKLAAQTREFSCRRGATLYMTLLAAFQALLHRCTGQRDLVVGSPAAGRTEAALAPLVGYFVNPVVLRSNAQGDPAFEAFLASARRSSLEALENQGYPFPLLAEKLRPERALSRSPIFQVMFQLQSAQQPEDRSLAAWAVGEPGVEFSLNGLKLESLRLPQRASQFDMTLVAAEVGEALCAMMEYSTDLFDRATVRRMLVHFEVLLQGAVSAPQRRLSELPLLTAAQQAQLRIEWGRSLPLGKLPERCLHSLFQRQAERSPEAVAVAHGRHQVSYSELGRRARRLACRLRSLGVRPEVRAGVLAERSIEALAGLLAVLQAGGVYVPLDPQDPRKRLGFVLQDAGIRVLLTRTGLASQLGLSDKRTPSRRMIFFDAGDWADGASGGDRLPPVFASSLAYTIYTSGSTGRPKGVMVSHRAAAGHLASIGRELGLTPRDRILQFAPLNFDPSIEQVFAALSCGALVVLRDAHLWPPEDFLARSAEWGLTVADLPTAYWHQLMRGLAEEGWPSPPHSLRLMPTGGEAMPTEAVRLWRISPLAHLEAWNMYGPTEAVITATLERLSPLADETHRIPIGRPMAGRQALVLDAFGCLLPICVAGELCLGGPLLARGYLGRSGLTAKRFVPDRWSEQPGARLYRSGDLVRCRPDGKLDFLGRIDSQVKVRGYRIELGEIEALAASHPEVAAAAAALRPVAGEAQVAAYLVPALPLPDASAQAGLLARLQGHLEQSLPAYMRPAAYQILSALPLKPSGKVDREALPIPQASSARRTGSPAAPRTQIEQMLAGIWCQLLETRSVGIYDNFFELGGHSLLAAQMLSRVRKSFGVELPLRTLFEAPTVAALAGRLQGAHSGSGRSQPPLAPASRDRPLPLSYAQEGLWFLDRLQPGSPAYNLPAAFHLKGRLDVSAFAWAVSGIIARHEALRTAFPADEDGGPAQLVAEPAPVGIPVADLSRLRKELRLAEFKRLATEEARRPFDLARGPLLRVCLLAQGSERHTALMTVHHIVSDGWSVQILLQELGILYQAARRGRPGRLPRLPVQYADYAFWQRRWLSGPVLKSEVEGWKRRLEGAPPLFDLPSDRPRPPVQSFRGQSLRFSLPEGLSAALQELSRAQTATLFMTLLAAFQALLCRLGGRRDMVVGTPVSNRSLEAEGLIGLFVNLLALRTSLAGNPGFKVLLQRVRSAALQAAAHPHLPFDRLVQEIQPQRNLSHAPLVQVVFALDNLPARPIRLPDLQMEAVTLETGTAKFDLALLMEGGPEGLSGTLECNADIFDSATARRLLKHFLTLLQGVAAQPDSRISDLPLLEGADRAQLLREWSDTTSAYPRQATIHQLFSQWAGRTPESVALVSGQQQLTYRELDGQSNRTARFLLGLGAAPDEPMGICLERSLEMVVCILGILKAGGAFLPLDPSYPRQRLRFMLEEASPPALLVRQRWRGKFPEQRQVVGLEGALAEIAAQEAAALNLEAAAQSLAYVMYTSGSTGRPKGVSVCHRSVVRLVRGTGYAEFSPREVFLQLAPIPFDASTLELWGPLLNGGRLVILPPHPPSLEELGTALARHGVTSLWLTAGLFQQMADGNAGGLAPLRQLLAGGDVLPAPQVKKVLRRLPGLRLINGYGPTENTTFSACHSMRSAEEVGHSVSIGRPIANSQAIVLDPFGQLVALGTAGELMVGGDGLARGYFRRPGITAEKFVPHPFGASGERLYRTGDLVRHRADGLLEFLGRLDRQVKLRGFRVELGEVESALLTHPQVGQCAVTIWGQGPSAQLAAYVSAGSDGTSPTGEELREHAARILPAYMVPAWVEELEALPLLPNGKVDRRALPPPGAGVQEQQPGFEPPRTPVEEILCGIWAELLGRTRAGREDHFFELGGHSLLATQAVSRVRRALGAELPLRALFEAPTPARLARRLEASPQSSAPIPPAPQDEAPVLSYSQERLWFLDQLEPGSTSYSIPAALELEGWLEPGALEAALRAACIRHDSLRSRFRERSGRPLLRIAPPDGLQLPMADLSRLDEEARQAEAQRWGRAEARRPFDLSSGPLLRAMLLRLGEGRHALLLNQHHIVSDGWSMGILARELTELYSAARSGRPARLQPLPIRYADYARWQRSLYESGAWEPQLAYWKDRLASLPPDLGLPTDRPRPAAPGWRGGQVPAALGPELAQQLRTTGGTYGATLFMVLLSGVAALLSRCSGSRDLAVGSPIANRTRMETEGLVGLLANTLVLRCDLSGDPSFGELAGRVREATLGAYAHQDLPFEKLVAELEPQRRLSRNPLFQVMLALQSWLSEELQAGDLSGRLLGLDGGTARFDLTFQLSESAQGVEGFLEYSAELYDRSTALRLAGHLKTLLQGAAEDPQQRLSELPLMPPSQRAQLLQEWGRGMRSDAGGSTLDGLFATQAALRPQARALLWEDCQLSYAGLDACSDRLAALLRQLGAGPEVRVGVLLRRRPELVWALVGILKAGAAYVGLDPAYPAERLRFMLEDSAAPLLISQLSLASLLPTDGPRALLLDEASSRLEQLPAEGLQPVGEPGRLAYLIYTSGSTGRPKGVAIEHSSAATLCRWSRQAFGDAELRGMLASTSVCFDLSVFELFVTLSRGGTVILAQDALELASLAAADQVTLLNTVPSVLSELLRLGPLPDGVRTVCLAGEPLPRNLAERLLEGGDRRLLNLYGPSEDTTYSTWAEVAPNEAPPIGRPVSGTSSYVLDGQGQPAPMGVPGELCLGGAGLARGYLGRPALTAERFVPDTFGDAPGGRLYRTGDLARHRWDGSLKFLGRLDDQLKLRGFRIEPGEIEAAFRRHPAVSEAAVLLRRDRAGNPRLAAYVASGPHPAPSSADLRRFLSDRLPEYMLPSAFVVLERLPLTPSGKVDRRALPQDVDFGAQSAYEPPRTQTEESLAGIWSELLGVEKAGIQDNFFELGGHSLLATQAISRIRQAFQAELPLRTIFEAPRLADLARRIDEAGAASAPPLAAGPRPEELPLSFAQQRLWFLNQLEPGNPFYNIPVAIRLRGRLQVGALEWAFNQVVSRHEALRTCFPDVDGRPLQLVRPQLRIGLALAELSALPAPARQRELSRLQAEEAQRPFDLAAGPLIRANLVRLAKEEHALLAGMHHIVSDDWSAGVLQHELCSLYEAALEGRPASLPALPVQYADFALWQRRRLSGEMLQEQLSYWTSRLSGAPSLELPADRPRPAVPSYRGGMLPFQVPGRLADSLRSLSRSREATLFMVLMAAFQLLMSRCSGQADISVGTPIANRNPHQTEGLIGFFLNTLVLRVRLQESGTFCQLLEQLREAALGAYSHQDIPFEHLVDALRTERAFDRAPLFQVMFTLQGPPQEMGFPELQADALPGKTSASRFDLTVIMREGPEGLQGLAEYSSDLFDRSSVQRLLGSFVRLLESVSASPRQPLRWIPLLDDAGRQQLLREWNDSDAPLQQALVQERVAAQSKRTPDSPALVQGTAQGTAHLSLAELNGRAEALSSRLRRKGAGPDLQAAIFLERSPEMALAVLAVLKSGAACLPVDPSYPEKRISCLLSDSRAKLALTRQSLLGRLPQRRPEAVCLDELPDSPSPAAPGRPASRENLAYVIYTSGSTGQPKGVGLTHRILANLIAWQLGGAPSPRRTVQFASLSFDVSFQEIFSAWCSGSALILASQEQRQDPEALAGLLAEERAEALFLPFVALQQLALATPRPASGISLRDVFSAGEQLQITPQLRHWLRQLPGCRLHNHYGPSETHVVTAWTCPSSASGLPALAPIGRPISNCSICLLDAHLQPVALGASGELSIGGSALARGYLGQPRQTAEKFIPDPFAPQPGSRLYRSGDLARFNPDGVIEFLGRSDHQVKIRGYRVELGEVEAVLSRHSRVRESAAALRETAQGSGRLVAYFVTKPELRPTGPAALPAGELRSFMQARLPGYMVPAAFVELKALPLTPSGKLDRRSLPQVEQASPPQGSDLPPRTPTEELLCGIWAEVLGLKRAGAQDDFFELGGHSLLATQATSRIRRAFGIELPLRTLFEAPTPAGLARFVEQAQRGEGLSAPPITPTPRQGPLPLSFSQLRQWLLDRLEPGDPGFNIPAAYRLQGPLDIPALRASLNEVVRRHEALRTVFGEQQGQPCQLILPRLELPLPLADLSGLEKGRRRLELRRLLAGEAEFRFDLSSGPLLRCCLFGWAAERWALAINMHHIVSDGWSVGVLVREVAQLYSAIRSGARPRLPRLPVQYADYARWQRDWLSGSVLEKGIDYWRNHLLGAPSELNLPLDCPRPALRSSQGASLQRRLPRRLSQAAAALSRQAGASLFMTLLAAFKALLSRCCACQDLTVGTYIANRHRQEVEGLIGFFINTLALRSRPRAPRSFGDYLDEVREAALAAYAHQDVPFEKVLDSLQPPRNPSLTPLFQAMCVLQNAPGDFPGLAGLSMRELEEGPRPAHFDLTLWLFEEDGCLRAVFQYARALFAPSTIARLAGHFEHLLAAAVADPARPLGGLPLLSPAQRHQLSLEWSQPIQQQSVSFAPVHSLFKARSAQAPDSTALADGDRQISCGELDRRSDRLADILRLLGAGPEVAVALALGRSPELIAGLLGILKSGSFYMPLDPAYPQPRLQFMIEDCRAAILLTESSRVDSLPQCSARMVCLDRLGPEGGPQPPAPQIGNGGSLAYCIYTSGSSGQPKGVLVEHASLSRYAWEAGQSFGLGPSDRVLQFASISFDTSAEEIYPALINGAALALRPETVQTAAGFLQGCRRLQLTMLDLPTAYWHELCRWLPEDAAPFPASVRLAVIGGEEANGGSLQVWQQYAGSGVRLLNTYGPTEATIVATACQLCPQPKAEHPLHRLPIGRPAAGKRAYAVGPGLGLTPQGCSGELLLGGCGLARGYLGRPRLTAQHWVPDPFSGLPGARLYRTGDLVRHRADGQLEFLGRVDHQFKLRGFRVELGEVEAVLLRHPQVRQGAAAARRDNAGGLRLVAYLSGRPPQGPPAAAQLRAWLGQRLPAHMVPGVFVELEQLPLTPSGKVDRQALPPPPSQGPARGGQARSLSEARLAKIWREALGLERVGVHDNFFELGGDSILGIQIIGRANQLGLQLSPQMLFQHQTIAELAAAAGRRTPIQAEQGLVSGAAPLTPYQAWFFEELRPDRPHHWNMALLLELRRPCSAAHLEKAFRELLRQHDALRLRFTSQGDGWQQSHARPQGAAPLLCVDLGALHKGLLAPAAERAAAQAQASLDLWEGPLLRAALFKRGAGARDRLLITIHHMAVDVVSWHILLEDLRALLEQPEGMPAALPPKTTSYKHWARRLAEHALQGDLQSEASHWLRPLPARLCRFAADNPGGSNVEGAAESVYAALDPERTRSLLHEVHQAYNTQMNDVLLTALLQAFVRVCGGQALLIHLEGHGREELFEDVDLSRTVGCFTSVFPVVLEQGQGDPGPALKSVKEQLRRIPRHGVGFGMLRYLSGNPQWRQRLGDLASAEASFNYVGQFDQALPEGSPFGLAQESAGPIRAPDAPRALPLEILAGVNGGRLEARWIFSRELHRKDSVEALAQAFQSALEELIEHCLSPDADSFTPSDFDLAGLDQDQLDDVITQIKVQMT